MLNVTITKHKNKPISSVKSKTICSSNSTNLKKRSLRKESLNPLKKKSYSSPMLKRYEKNSSKQALLSKMMNVELYKVSAMHYVPSREYAPTMEMPRNGSNVCKVYVSSSKISSRHSVTKLSTLTLVLSDSLGSKHD